MLCVTLAVLLVLVGCSGFLRGDSGSAASVADCLSELGPPPAPLTGVFVQPDDGYPPVVDEFSRARCTIDLTIYMLTDDTIFTTLIDAAHRGVRVRVILDEHPFGMFGDQGEAMQRLKDGGVEVLWGSKLFQFTHAKYIVIDSRVAVIMNQNLTRAAFDGNREYGVVTTFPDAVAQAQDVFIADWTGSPFTLSAGPLIISPATSRSRIVALIGSAGKSIDFYAEVIRDEGIIAALRAAVQRGVHVRLIVNSSLDPADLDALVQLSTIGVEVRMMEVMYIHAKTMIIDDNAALIGSQNYTMTSLDRNREVGMVVDNPALLTRVVTTYERDWVRAVPAGVVSGNSPDRTKVRVEPEPAREQGSLLMTKERRMISTPLTLTAESVYSVRTVPKGWTQGTDQLTFIQADNAAGHCPSPHDRQGTGGERYALRGVVSKRS